jgi:hypothetical protein
MFFLVLLCLVLMASGQQGCPSNIVRGGFCLPITPVALWNFRQGTDPTRVPDIVGGMDLEMLNAQKISWGQPGSIKINNAAAPFGALFNRNPAKFAAAVRASGKFSVELWVLPHTAIQGAEAPARIFSVARDDSCNANLALMQAQGDLMTMLSTIPAAKAPLFPGWCPNDLLFSKNPPFFPETIAETHFVWTWDGEFHRIYVNGENVLQEVRQTDAKAAVSWLDNNVLSMGHVVSCLPNNGQCTTSASPVQFSGNYHLAALYDQALSPEMVKTLNALGTEAVKFVGPDGVITPTKAGPLPGFTTTTTKQTAPTTASTTSTAPAPTNPPGGDKNGTLPTAAPGPNPFNNPFANPFLPNVDGVLATGVQCEIRMDDMLETFDVQQFTKNLAVLLRVPTNRIGIISVRRGSVIVTFQVLDRPESDGLGIVTPLLNEFSTGAAHTRAREAGIPPVLEFRVLDVNNPLAKARREQLFWILIISISALTLVVFIVVLIIACCRISKYKNTNKDEKIQDYGIQVFSKK